MIQALPFYDPEHDYAHGERCMTERGAQRYCRRGDMFLSLKQPCPIRGCGCQGAPLGDDTEAALILASLRAAGLTVRASEGMVILSPRGRITVAVLELVKAHKPAILAELASEQARAGSGLLSELTRCFAHAVDWSHPVDSTDIACMANKDAALRAALEREVQGFTWPPRHRAMQALRRYMTRHLPHEGPLRFQSYASNGTHL